MNLEPRAATARTLVMREEAVIPAKVEDVWGMLVEIDQYRNWNPWLVRAWGDVKPGGVVWAEVNLGGKKPMRAKHRVLVVEPCARLVWRDAGWNALFVYGQRVRRLEKVDGGVKLTQELMVDGALRGTVEKMYGAALRAGLVLETRAIAAALAPTG